MGYPSGQFLALMTVVTTAYSGYSSVHADPLSAEMTIRSTSSRSPSPPSKNGREDFMGTTRALGNTV
jgi:hypothetical protein